MCRDTGGMNFLLDALGEWQGTNGFRLMPDHDLAVATSRAWVHSEASGWAQTIRYCWTHPQDGEQQGVLMLGSPAEDGSINAGWVDSWHQKPHVALVAGTTEKGRVRLEMEYGGWTWQIVVESSPESLNMVMRNVIPADINHPTGTAYVVMDARWERLA